jgi:hypothetical protein
MAHKSELDGLDGLTVVEGLQTETHGKDLNYDVFPTSCTAIHCHSVMYLYRVFFFAVCSSLSGHRKEVL